MSGLPIRKSKIIKQIQQEQKHKYFQQIRKQLVRVINHQIEQQSENSKKLKYIIKQSLVSNRALKLVREDRLVDKLRQLGSNTLDKNQIILILMLFGNLLLDELTIQEREIIINTSFVLYQRQILQKHFRSSTWIELTDIIYLLHLFHSITLAIGMVDEKLSVYCERIIIKETVRFAEEIVLTLNGHHQQQSEAQKKIIYYIFSILKAMLFSEPQYQGQVRTRFQRNISEFVKMLDIHSKVAFLQKMNHNICQFHKGMLEIQQIVTTQLDLNQYPLYFQSNTLLTISLNEVYCNKQQYWNQLALSVLVSLFQSCDNSFLIMGSISNWLKQIQDHLFFKTLIQIDDLVESRVKLLRIFMTQQNYFSFIESFFKEYWKILIDYCWQLLNRKLIEQYELQNNLLQILVIIMQKINFFEGPNAFQFYLQGIGGQALINFYYYNQKQTQQSHLIIQQISQKCHKLLSKLEKYKNDSYSQL